MPTSSGPTSPRPACVRGWGAAPGRGEVGRADSPRPGATDKGPSCCRTWCVSCSPHGPHSLSVWWRLTLMVFEVMGQEAGGITQSGGLLSGAIPACCRWERGAPTAPSAQAAWLRQQLVPRLASGVGAQSGLSRHGTREGGRKGAHRGLGHHPLRAIWGPPVRSSSWGPSPTPCSFSKVPWRGVWAQQSPPARVSLECPEPMRGLATASWAPSLGLAPSSLGMSNLVTRDSSCPNLL